jgi:DNA/RNA endonuclease G (NUC1)
MMTMTINKTLGVLLMLFIINNVSAQKVKIDNPSFTIKHKSLTFYLDKDTASYISVQEIKISEIMALTGKRSDKWHKEKPFGPYYKDAYRNTGYDLGHLTPSNITSYDDSLNYFSFSLFNQAPQLAGFNRGNWAQLEGDIEDLIKIKKGNAIIVTGVIYDNYRKQYLGKSRIKIPLAYYKILVFNDGVTKVWLGSNINGLVTETDLKTVLDMAKDNGNKLRIRTSK